MRAEVGLRHRDGAGEDRTARTLPPDRGAVRAKPERPVVPPPGAHEPNIPGTLNLRSTVSCPNVTAYTTPKKGDFSFLSTNCTVQLPAAICAGYPNVRVALRELLGEALDANLTPALAWPEGDLVRVSLYLSGETTVQVRRIAQELHLPLDKVVAGLAYARANQGIARGLAHGPALDSTTQTEVRAAREIVLSSSSIAPDNRTALQNRLRVPLMTGLNAGKIVFAEGGTGLGKSRVIAQCALEYLQTRKGAKGLVLAPTVSVLSHLVREFRKVVPDDFHDFCVVLGRSQFVSRRRLETLLAAPVPNPALAMSWDAAQEWCRGGGKALPLGASLGHEFAICWLADELRRAAPQFPVDDVLLGGADEGDASDPAEMSYQALRAQVFDQNIKLVFATQAMACLNVWSFLRPDRQKGILPPFDIILIDEAHELEEVMARTIGSSISLLHMRQVLRQGLDGATGTQSHLAAEAIRALSWLDQAERALRQIPSSCLITSWSESDSENPGTKQAFAKFLKVARDLDESLEKLSQTQEDPSGSLPIRLLQEWHNAFRQMLDGRQNVWLDFSPVIRTPRITVGPSQLIRPFEELWRSCQAAGLLSGTLYLPNADGRISSAFMRMKLLVPRDRAHEINPVHPSWNFTVPTVYIPDATAARHLLYPGTAEDERGVENVAHWHHAVVERLTNIVETAAGGTLVLCCSYLDVRTFAGLLAETLGERLLTSRGSSSARTLAGEFIQLSRQKLRPVWLATGSAWTGLDLSDHDVHDPAQDFTLTDLVITRVPFGTNKTAVHLARSKRLGFDVECMEAALRLKQGLGRLIRREGLTKRRIWMLDGRSHSPRSGYFRRVFGPVFAYPNQEFFT